MLKITRGGWRIDQEYVQFSVVPLNTSLAVRRNYHMMHEIGKLKLADYDNVKDLMYLVKRCCSDLVTKHNVISEQIQGFLYKKMLKNFRVCSGEKLIRWEDGVPSAQLKTLWGQGLVHLTTSACKAMAEKAVIMLKGAPFIHPQQHHR